MTRWEIFGKNGRPLAVVRGELVARFVRWLWGSGYDYARVGDGWLVDASAQCDACGERHVLEPTPIFTADRGAMLCESCYAACVTFNGTPRWAERHASI